MRSDHLILGLKSIVALGEGQSRPKKAEFHGVMSQKWNVGAILRVPLNGQGPANKRLILWSKPVRIPVQSMQ